MTEEEAKEKWCPMSRVTTDFVGGLVDNKQYNGIITSCIGSDCMAWRCEYKKEQREGHNGGKEMLFSRGTETNRTPRRDGYDLWVLDESGYCGLAGKP